MTSFDITAAIDAVTADLQAQRVALGLPAFSVQKYVAPLWLDGEMCQPLLAVYVQEVDPILETTSGEYDYRWRVCIGWYESVVDSLNTGQVDNATAAGIVRHGQIIYKYVGATYYAGLPGYSPESEVTVRKVRFGKPMGGVYGMECELYIADWI